jgi:hypothetical protein
VLTELETRHLEAKEYKSPERKRRRGQSSQPNLFAQLDPIQLSSSEPAAEAGATATSDGRKQSKMEK